MMGKPVALIHVPEQRGFTIGEAARYLGICHQKLRHLADSGKIRCRRDGNFRMFLLEDLDGYLESMPDWGADGEEKPKCGGLR